MPERPAASAGADQRPTVDVHELVAAVEQIQELVELPDHLTEVLERIVAGADADRAGRADDLRDRSTPASPVAARNAGRGALADAAPDQHAVLLEAWRSALMAALEQRAYRVRRGVRERVIAIAHEMAALGADPRDCVAMHATVLAQVQRRGVQASADAVTHPDALVEAAREESVMVLVEVLGHLARAYRDGVPSRRPPP